MLASDLCFFKLIMGISERTLNALISNQQIIALEFKAKVTMVFCLTL